MPYIGRSTDGFGVRSRFVYLASSGDTSVSGADANGATLTFTDGAYVDVYLNGVLLKPTTDYNTSTAGTIAGLSALNTNDEVTVIVYDVFTVADMVSATSGGTFSGAVTVDGDLTVDTDTLFVDVSQDNVGINTNAVDSDVALEVNGNVAFKNGSNYSLYADVDGALTAYHNGSSKLATTANGIGVEAGAAYSHDTNMKGMDAGDQAFYGEYDGGSLYIVKNRYYNGSNWVAKENGAGSAINMDTSGFLHWQHSPNVNAGQNATLSTRFTFANEYAQWSSERNSLAFYINNSHSSDPHCLYLNFTGAAPDDNTRYFMRAIDTSATRFTIFSDGDVATADAGTLSSDIKLKNTITDATDKWDDVKKLKVRNFYWNEDYHPNKKDKKMIGFIAQEFETVFPKLVTELKDEESVQEKDENGETKTVIKDLGTTTKHIKEGKLIPILTKALQEAMTRIETLEAKVKALEEA